ncbi:hypothetical protein [Dethiobacter alkaliphilus]|uniref:Uncharacterized protein n=1 Tax=Dethiobacter alkaliphilus AHT 1 TaxID=555088 RepID=C0GCN1_DETAL|nr:hypothetical protein [Dethiobacter alkaliphilus]EEG78966.1 hypothetical protein DealDRAFT_0240 [Dethiobacter alkaliphilus AHT 1]
MRRRVYSTTSFYEKENKTTVQQEAPLQQPAQEDSVGAEAIDQPQQPIPDAGEVSQPEIPQQAPAPEPELVQEEPSQPKASGNQEITAEIALEKMLAIYAKTKKNN